jgi:UDP-N-acetylmuramoyl-tripeptide--D-alanyl-D-alanine ligase
MLSLTQTAKILNAELSGQDNKFLAVSIDSRSVKTGDLFIAIKGEKFDGHHFVAEAKSQGAVAAVVQQKVAIDIPQIIVPDTRKALGSLAAYWRNQFKIPVLALTGSCGKTTTKTMLASIFAQKGQVLSPQSSYNNDIGLPLTLLKLRSSHQEVVLEIGANHVGEIAYLTKIAQPDVAAVLNIGNAHLEGFGDKTGVAKEKSDIFKGLTSNGIAVINDEDEFASFMRDQLKSHPYITFGLKPSADVYGTKIRLDEEGKAMFTLNIAGQSELVTLPTLGEHNVMNALAAAVMAHAVHVPLQQIVQGLQNMQVVAKRLNKRRGLNKSIIIDDTYNAIPNAVEAALKLLARADGERIFVFGGMAELGAETEKQHKQIGQFAKANNIHRLLAVGVYSHLTVDAFGAGAELFTSKADLINQLRGYLHSEATILVKGSRGSRMEDVVEEIIEKDPL